MDSSALNSQIIAASVESGRGMGSAGKENKDEGMTELFKLNQVYYRMPPTLSLVSKRTMTKCNFQMTSYPAPLNQRVASCIFNTGEFQVAGKTSFLVIRGGIEKSDVGFLGIGAAPMDTADNVALYRLGANALLGQGGILNIIEEVTFLSASGTEVDRQQNKGLQAAHVTRNRMSPAWFNTIGESQGYPGGPYQDCYDRKGSNGFVQPTGTGAAISAQAFPLRGLWTTDWSKNVLNLTGATSNTNATTVTATNATVYDNNRSLPTEIAMYTGSVNVSYNSTFNATWNTKPGRSFEFIVPLCELLGMFCPYMNALIPSQALAGGRMELRFKNMTEALIATGPGFNPVAASRFDNATAISNANTFLNAFKIDDIYLLLDSYQMNDSVLKKLNEVAAGSEGLSVMFDTWDWTQTQVTTLSFEAQVSQARSRITRSFAIIRDQMVTSHPFANSLASESATERPWAFSKHYSIQQGAGNYYRLLVNMYQAQLGSLYFPQQPLTYLEEYVSNAYYVWCKGYQNYDEVNAVSLSDFTGGQGNGLFTVPPITPQAPLALAGASPGMTDFERLSGIITPTWVINWGSATYGFLAERSQLLQLTGLPISNARLLRHRFILNYQELSQSGRLIDVFTEYTRVMKVFLGGRIVMRE